MSAYHRKFGPITFPNPEKYDDVKKAYIHLQNKGFVFTEPKGDDDVVGMRMVKGWSYFNLNDERWMYLNPQRMPEVLVCKYHVKKLEDESVEEEENEEENEEEIDALKNVKLTSAESMSILALVVSVMSRIPSSHVMEAYIIDGWNDPQISPYALVKITTPLPDFYDVSDSVMELNEFHHFMLLKDKIISLKFDYERQAYRVRKKAKGLSEEFEEKRLKLRKYVAGTDMDKYKEFRKYVKFLNVELPVTQEDIYQHYVEKYKKYCRMTPQERTEFSVKNKFTRRMMWMTEIIDFNEGVDPYNLDFDENNIPISMVQNVKSFD